MPDEISDLRFFCILAAAGSIAGCARVMGMSPAAMSRRLSGFEARLGTRLVTRTSRHFALTAEGQRLHERATRIMHEIEEAEAEVTAKAGIPHGLLRVGVPSELGRKMLAGIVAAFVEKYPDVTVHLTLSDAGLDVIDDGLDIAIRAGMPPDQGVMTTTLISSRRVVCAAPSYSARKGLPATPHDLLRHDCICLLRRQRIFNEWAYYDGKTRKEIHVTPHLAASSSEVVHDWAVNGQGIALKVLWDIADDLKCGRLIECLSAYAWEDVVLCAVYPSRTHLPPRMRFFLDFVKRALRQHDFGT
ncbi:LysR family transcriptional regulator [Gluconacetobacter entanii]|uniref:LysR family transcriptional regulator n=1 Tax=Gluconacetobacter entanii TaxID=108528 RepID=A0ABT3K9T6_9PROT|nr:LysR family transcriptional regulator [Gluconacetobacter entanii]MBE7618060.1 LysR family transcriptional regulator [Komagataeibacter sp. FXV2]MCE2577754.1 LysR family transcriptional regulator [Komagataeibacter sp. FNDCR1]MCW4592170.1 LysR family transcriptional regulator [Gluconacetobacter entanii]MCW4595821.1 LysR family transcriptional regulator [Gluconacetobacter entanii]NPC87385.1 LysR family transcriptional regulator [Gluconacetobacter entanii]